MHGIDEAQRKLPSGSWLRGLEPERGAVVVRGTVFEVVFVDPFELAGAGLARGRSKNVDGVDSTNGPVKAKTTLL